MIVVLDASAGIEIILARPRAEQFSNFIRDSDVVLSTELYRAETANTLWKYYQHGLLTEQEALQKSEDVVNIVDQFFEIKKNLYESLSEAMKLQHSVYDLLYLTLARRQGATLVSLDKKLLQLCKECKIHTLS